jgi:hypothetical protein
MADYSLLKDIIDDNITNNGQGEITGPVLNGVLTSMVQVLGAGYQFKGFADTDTDPGTPDARVFYLATEAGTYTNFGGSSVTVPTIFYYDNDWHTETLDGDFSATLRVADIINALNSTAADKPLSANQGKVLKDLHDTMKGILEAGDIFMGVATDETVPEVSNRDYSYAWLTATAGTYTNMGNLVVAAGEIAVLRRYTTGGDTTAWEKKTLGTYLTGSDIVDNLNSSDATKALSAKQGKALKALIDAGYAYGGTITSEDARTPSLKIFFLATTAGTIHGVTVAANEIAFIKYDGSDWSKDSLGVLATSSDLSTAVGLLDDAIGAKYTKPAGGIPSTDMTDEVQALLAKADSAIQESDLETTLEDYAKVDGLYENMTVGNALNILSEDVVTEQTTLGVTAPDSEIGNGSARMQTIEGDGISWSQLYDKMAGGASVATEAEQLEFLYGKVVERFSNSAGTTPMPSLFLREFLTGADLTGRVAVTGEGFVPAVTEENQSNYTGLHYKVRATHAEAVQRSGEEGSYTYSSAFFVGGSNFSASAKRNVIDMALAFGIESYSNDTKFRIPTSAPSTLAQMYGWLGSKVGLSDDYDYNGGELIGVKVLQLRSMPGVNLLDPTSGVALCPFYEWENADGLYRVVARNGAVISGVVATALGGQPVEVVEVTAGSVYEVSVPEGDAVVMQVTLSSGSLADCAAWQVWDDSTPSDEVGGYTRSLLSLEVGRVYGKLNGEGEYVKVWSDGCMKGATNTARLTYADLINIADDSAEIWIEDFNMTNRNWSLTSGRFDLYMPSLIAANEPVICKLYPNAPYQTSNGRNSVIVTSPWGNLMIKDSSYNGDTSAFKAAMNGVHAWLGLKASARKSYTSLMYDTRPDLTVGEPVLVPLSTYFPGTYQVGNTGVTMQAQNWDDQTQRFAATPQSAAAQTSSVMPGNYVEMLRSLQQMSILDGWVSPDQFHAHQSATVQALNAMATANQLSGQFSLTPQDDVAYSNE